MTKIRWSREEQDKIFDEFRKVNQESPGLSLLWKINESSKKVLPENRVRNVAQLGRVSPYLLKKIALAYPELAEGEFYKSRQLLARLRGEQEQTSETAVDSPEKDEVAEMLAEQRLSRPADDFADIYNEVISAAPELDLPQISSAKYADKDLMQLFSVKCKLLLDPPEPEEPVATPPQAPPPLNPLGLYYEAVDQRFKKLEERLEKLMNDVAKGVVPEGAKAAQLETVETPPAKEDPEPRVTLGCDRKKIKILILDHEVAKRPDEFQRLFEDDPKYRFKFDIRRLDGKYLPNSVGGDSTYAIVHSSAPLQWRQTLNLAFQNRRYAIFEARTWNEAVNAMSGIKALCEKNK